MPARDGTGPAGKGSRTGRGLGLCNNDELQNENPRIGKFGIRR